MPIPQIIDLAMVTLSGYFMMGYLCRIGVREKADDSLQLRTVSLNHWLGLVVCMCALAAIDLFVPYGNLFLLPLSACGLFNIISDCKMFLLSNLIRSPQMESQCEGPCTAASAEATQKEQNNSPVQDEESQCEGPCALASAEVPKKEENNSPVQDVASQRSSPPDPYRVFY